MKMIRKDFHLEEEEWTHLYEMEVESAATITELKEKIRKNNLRIEEEIRRQNPSAKNWSIHQWNSRMKAVKEYVDPKNFYTSSCSQCGSQVVVNDVNIRNTKITHVKFVCFSCKEEQTIRVGKGPTRMRRM